LSYFFVKAISTNKTKNNSSFKYKASYIQRAGKLGLSVAFGIAVLPTMVIGNVTDSNVTSEKPTPNSELPLQELPGIRPITIPTVSFVAKLNQFNLREPDAIDEHWVQVSPDGMRIKASDGSFTVVKNFSQRRVWMINSKKKIQHEIDVTEFEQVLPHLSHYLLGVETESNVLGHSACNELSGELVGQRTWRGEVVEEWRCSDDSGGLINTQYFSQRWKFVVRVEAPDLTVEEVVNIKEQSIAISEFQGESDFNSVDMQFFFEGKRKLEKYDN